MKNFIIALTTGLTAMLHGQNTLTGIVSDKNGPLAGVSIYAPDLHKGTSTDSGGKYSMGSLPSGNIRIVFSFLGYKTRNENVAVQKQSTFDVSLEESIDQMDEVIVSTAFNRLQSQNVMKVEHETVKSLQQKGVTTLIEGLATIPGVSQISTGASIGKPVIRGLSSNRVLVYSQGVRLENQQFGDEHGLGLNDSGIESLEVIKGPASLLYGSDALGGVLYFNPEKFAEAKTCKADISERLFSNTIGSSTSAGFKGSGENWKFLARGSYATHSDYEIPDGDRVTNTRFNEADLKGGIGYGNSAFSSLFRYNFNRLDLGIPEDGITEQSKSKKTIYPKQAVDNHIFSLHNNIFLGNSTLDADIGYIYNDRSEFEDSDIAALHLKLRTLNYDFKFHFPKRGKFETIIGAQGMYQTNANSGEEFLIPDANTDDFGIFATSSFDWKSGIFQAGFRYDNRKVVSDAHGTRGEEGYFAPVDRSFDSFNASVGYKTDLITDLSLRLNVATGFRAPNLAELTSNGVHEGTNRYEIGNDLLVNEQNLQADVNLEYKNTHFEFFVNGFYNHINHYIYASPTGEIRDDNVVYNYIQADAKLFGGEAGLHFHPHPLDWLHFESSFETVTGEKSNGDYLPLIPANSLDNTLRAEFASKLWLTSGFAKINVVTTFDQNNVDGFETASADYTLFNAGVGGTIRFGKSYFDLSLNGNNLFDKTYIAHLSRLKADGIPNQGRNVVLGISFKV